MLHNKRQRKAQVTPDCTLDDDWQRVVLALSNFGDRVSITATLLPGRLAILAIPDHVYGGLRKTTKAS